MIAKEVMAAMSKATETVKETVGGNQRWKPKRRWVTTERKRLLTPEGKPGGFAQEQVVNTPQGSLVTASSDEGRAELRRRAIARRAS